MLGHVAGYLLTCGRILLSSGSKRRKQRIVRNSFASENQIFQGNPEVPETVKSEEENEDKRLCRYKKRLLLGTMALPVTLWIPLQERGLAGISYIQTDFRDIF